MAKQQDEVQAIRLRNVRRVDAERSGKGGAHSLPRCTRPSLYDVSCLQGVFVHTMQERRAIELLREVAHAEAVEAPKRQHARAAKQARAPHQIGARRQPKYNLLLKVFNIRPTKASSSLASHNALEAEPTTQEAVSLVHPPQPARHTVTMVPARQRTGIRTFAIESFHDQFLL